MSDAPLPYHRYRTGMTFGEVRMQLAEEARQALEQEGRRMFVSRSTVLGRWRQLKLASYRGYLLFGGPWPVTDGVTE